MGKKFKHIEKKITLVGTIRKYSRPFFITTGLIFVVSIFWNYGTTFTKSTKISDEALQQQLEIAPSVVDGEAVDENSVSRLVGAKVQQWRMGTSLPASCEPRLNLFYLKMHHYTMVNWFT